MAPPPPPQQPSPPPPADLMAVNAKRYTLAALLASFTAAAIVTTTFVILCPAHITFSVAHTSSSTNTPTTTSSGGGQQLVLRLTLAAENPSRRASVRYESLFVDVSNGTGGTAAGAAQAWDNWVRAAVSARMPMRQRARSTAEVDAAVALVDAPWTEEFTGRMSSRFSVMVTAQARFRVGVAWTRLYDIKVYCSPISFFPSRHDKAASSRRAAGGGGGGGEAAGGLPVRCV